MSLDTNLIGRLNNTTLPKSHGLLPLFEAVVNSIHSIEERKIDFETSYIKIEIIRSNQMSLDFKDKSQLKPDITGFKISDNGIGFNEVNFKSFKTLDSDYKVLKGCRGIGRLLWLKAFNNVKVNSCYMDSDNSIKKLTFDFDIENDVSNEKRTKGNEVITTIELMNVEGKYLKHIKKTANAISKVLLEHILWYYIRKGGCPKISIIDEDEVVSLDTIFESYMFESSETEKIIIKDEQFNITHVKLLSTSSAHHSIAYCAANRIVKEENLKNKITGLFGSLNDGEREFTYLGFISSSFLDKTVRPERIGFNINEEIDELFEDTEISFNDIRGEVKKSISNYLNDYLKENRKIGIEKVTSFINSKAPRYKPILERISENDKIVDPSISDKDLELKLHKHLMEVESELLAEGHDLMIPANIENEDDYVERIEEYLSKASDIKKSDLANYVSHRMVIIDLLSKAIEMQDNGKYSKEEIIHNLIMPMQKNSTNLFCDDMNLWLIDERLAFHNYLASDKTINSMPITDNKETKEPDILSLNVYDNPILINDGPTLPLASISVIEIKRPMRNDAKEGEEKDPIEQALGYLERIRNGNVKTELGRPIPNSQDIPGFCYILCDITSTIQKRCGIFDLQVTSDKLGYFGFNKTYNSYIEVISFDRLLNMARERNRAFFDKLGLPTA